ncbi:hypothetical protein M885DRAFT_578573 [Pelagophyceae sp. CCMP2097]|nr:hypothetical protein M885DRAFT_578573 [Pelagophyceae sp. CCMP2097]
MSEEAAALATRADCGRPAAPAGGVDGADPERDPEADPEVDPEADPLPTDILDFFMEMPGAAWLHCRPCRADPKRVGAYRRRRVAFDSNGSVDDAGVYWFDAGEDVPEDATDDAKAALDAQLATDALTERTRSSVRRSNVGGSHSDVDMRQAYKSVERLGVVADQLRASLRPFDQPSERAFAVSHVQGAVIVDDAQGGADGGGDAYGGCDDGCDANGPCGAATPAPKRCRVVEESGPEAWFNVSGVGEYQRLHDHRSHTWAAVYWVSVPSPRAPPVQHSGALVLELSAPRDGPAAGRYAVLRPIAGAFCFFPAALRHCVLPVAPGASDELRISVAFNFPAAETNETDASPAADAQASPAADAQGADCAA